ncbi:MAG: hypothetical protein WCP95_07040 [Actinomycetes bacterium]
MRRLRATATSAVILLLSVGQVAPAVAIADGLTTATAGGTRVVVTIPDVIFEGPECMNAPVKATFDQVDSFATVHLAAAITGSNNALSMSLLANASGPIKDTFQVCPSIDGPGAYNVSGTLNTAVEAAEFAPAAFNVSRAPTQFSALAASVRRGTLTVTGKVVARTNRGAIGAAGTIRLYGYLSKVRGGTGKWTSIGSAFPDQFGAFRVSGATNRRLNGAFIRALFLPDPWCLASRQVVRIP